MHKFIILFAIITFRKKQIYIFAMKNPQKKRLDNGKVQLNREKAKDTSVQVVA